jgi:hypothetical protein
MDDELLGDSPDEAHLFRLMEWQLDLLLSEAVQDRLLLHAGAVAYQGRGIILPAVSGSGKSSLTMGLLLAGGDYLSDELAVIDPATGWLSAFPKPFSVKNIAIFDMLRDQPWFGPDEATIRLIREEAPDYQPVWYLHPETLRPGCISGPVPLDTIIFPRYDAAAALEFVPVAPGDVMRLLIENAVNFQLLKDGGFRLLARLVNQSRAYHLRFPDWQSGVQAIRQHLESRGA